MDPTKMQLLVTDRRDLTPSIAEFVLTREGSAPLPIFPPGSHISVETPSGAMRRYSLVNDGCAPDRYVIAVKREVSSRGGSQSMHDKALVGTTLQVDEPENEFSLAEAPKYLLIAGGIGITPIFAMAKHLRATPWDVRRCGPAKCHSNRLVDAGESPVQSRSKANLAVSRAVAALRCNLPRVAAGCGEAESSTECRSHRGGESHQRKSSCQRDTHWLAVVLMRHSCRA